MNIPSRALLVCLLALNGCKNTHQAASEQCQTIAKHYLNVADKIEVNTVVTGDETTITLAFAVRSALGTQPGQASCSYRDTQVTPLRPHRITLGNTVFRQAQDIQDLLDLRTEWPDLHHNH